MLRLPPLRSIILASLTVGLLAACVGLVGAAAPDPFIGAPAATPTVTNRPSATQPAATPAASPILDLGLLGGAIPGLDSYRTSFSAGGVLQYQTVVVAGPGLSKAITAFASDGTVSDRIIVIGDDAWQASGPDGKFKKAPVGSAAMLLSAYDPALLLAGYANLDVSTAGPGADKGLEAKNGATTRHLKVDSTTFAHLSAGWPAGAVINVWKADGGYLTAWEMTGFGKGSDISIEVTNVNDPSNSVEAP